MNAEKLDGSLLEEIENYAIDIAQQAGQILWEQFRKPLEIQFKDKENMLIRSPSADRLSDEYLKRAISQKFPRHNILSEEGGVLARIGFAFCLGARPAGWHCQLYERSTSLCGFCWCFVEKTTRGRQYLCAGKSAGCRRRLSCPSRQGRFSE